MKQIANAKTDEIAACLSNVARSKDLLESKYHKEYMKQIANAKTDEIAYSLRDVAYSKDLLESKYHKEYMKLIANGKSVKEAEKIYDGIIKEKYRIYSMTFQEKIDAIHQNAVEYTDGDTTKELNDSVFTLK